jgi:hypothetical protein
LDGSGNIFHDLTVNSGKSITTSNEDEAVPTIPDTERASTTIRASWFPIGSAKHPFRLDSQISI